MATGHYAKALRCFEAVEEWDEGAYVEARMQRAIILAAAPEKSLRNIEVAEELARQACAISNFTDWQSLHVFAIATAANGKFDKATEYIEQALEDVPDDQLARVRKDANVIKAGEAVLLNKDGVAPFLE
jgi:tetratricopeptide (TPR) repeat protein